MKSCSIHQMFISQEMLELNQSLKYVLKYHMHFKLHPHCPEANLKEVERLGAQKFLLKFSFMFIIIMMLYEGCTRGLSEPWKHTECLGAKMWRGQRGQTTNRSPTGHQGAEAVRLLSKYGNNRLFFFRWRFLIVSHISVELPLDKMAAVLQTIFSAAVLCTKKFRI